jgi:glycosyltransferase involved in cell wall biosynthesis
MSERMAGPRKCGSLSIIVPVYNEEEVLPLLWERLRPVMDSLSCPSEVLFVDDGSRDGSLDWIFGTSQKDERVGALSFVRNFGQQAAITAGLDWADGDAVVIMDADLQDPPEVIVELLQRYEEGYCVVYARRRIREGEGWFRRLTAFLFYRIMRACVGLDLPTDVGDFRLVSRDVVATLRTMREQHRFMRGMVAWAGHSHTAVEFDRPPRAAGSSKYGLGKMTAFAWSAVTSVSAAPLRAGFYVGLLMLLACALYALRLFYVRFVLGTAVPGWTTIVLLQLGFSGLIMFYLGLIGDYVGRLYEQSKDRPLYVLRDAIGRAARHGKAQRSAD